MLFTVCCNLVSPCSMAANVLRSRPTRSTKISVDTYSVRLNMSTLCRQLVDMLGVCKQCCLVSGAAYPVLQFVSLPASLSSCSIYTRATGSNAGRWQGYIVEEGLAYSLTPVFGSLLSLTCMAADLLLSLLASSCMSLSQADT